MGTLDSRQVALPQMRAVGGFGEMLEDKVEKSHQDMDRFHQRVGRLENPALVAKSSTRITRKQ